MHELMGVSLLRVTNLDGVHTWRAKVTMVGSSVEEDFENRDEGWRFVWRWLSKGRTD